MQISVERHRVILAVLRNMLSAISGPMIQWNRVFGCPHKHLISLFQLGRLALNMTPRSANKCRAASPGWIIRRRRTPITFERITRRTTGDKVDTPIRVTAWCEETLRNDMVLRCSLDRQR